MNFIPPPTPNNGRTRQVTRTYPVPPLLGARGLLSRLPHLCQPILIALCLFPAYAQTPSPTPPSADTLFAAGQFEPARQSYAAAEKAAPDDIAPRVGLIRTLLRQDNWPDALTEAQNAAPKFPASADAHGLLALSLIRAGWQSDYAKEAAQALTLDPKDYWGLIASGRAAEWDGKYAAARGFFRQASVIHPEWPEAWLGLVETLTSKSDKDEKAKATHTYLKLSPQGQPHDRMRERLSDLNRNTEAYQQGFGTGPLFERVLPKDSADKLSSETLPINFLGDYIVLPVTINGSHFRLILDTGAGGKITLNSSAARRLKLTPVAHSFVRGVSGRENSDILKGETLTLGSRTYRSVVIDTMSDLPGNADGLFGGNILRDSVVTVDYAASTLTLASGTGATAPVPASVSKSIYLPFHVYQSHLYLPLSVNAKPLWALLDTGATLTHLSLREAKSRLKDVPKTQVHSGTVKRRIGIGQTNPQVEFIASRTPSQLNLSTDPPVNIPISTLGLSELDGEVSPSADFEIGLLLGMSSLTYARRITLDYPHRQLVFEYKDPGAAAGKTSTP